MKIHTSVAIVLLILGTSACQTASSRRAELIDEGLLLNVSDTERSNIADARKSRDQASDAYAAAQSDYARAVEARAVAGQVCDAAAAKASRTQDTLNRASQSGTVEDVSIAKQKVLEATAEKAVHTAKLSLSDKQADYANALAVLAKEHVQVTEARVNLAKAKAVNTLDRPRSQTPKVSMFETSLRLAEADENLARTRSESAQREVSIATDLVAEREKAYADLQKQD
jgi:hypothetical protein